uniref:glucuronosyltransferase n=1 Tax=Acrobeloides nanus TaxID=290746 RepID=A0A914DZL5_9BILA
MILSNELKQMINTGVQEHSAYLKNALVMLPKIVKFISLPCALNDTNLIINSMPNGETMRMSIIDTASVMCAVVVARRLKSDFVFVSALVDPMTIAYLTGAPLSISSTMSLIVAKTPEEMTFFDRLANIFGHYFFTIVFMQLPIPIAKFFYGQENSELFKPQENTLLFSNNHKLIDWPIARTHGLIDIGNLDEEDEVLTEKIDTIKNSTVYDIRWPIMDSVANYPTRKGFKKIVFPDAMIVADEMKKMLNAGIKENSASFKNMFTILPKFGKVIFLPCALNDTILIINSSMPNGETMRMSIMDQFGVLCSVVVARRLKSDFVFVSALVEPMTIAYLTGAPLSISSTMSVAVARPPEEMTIFDRLANIFGFYFFSIVFVQLPIPIAKFFYGQENPEIFKPVENTLLFSNNHKFIDLPTARTHGLIEIGNLEEEDIVLTEKIDTKIKNFIDSNKFDGFIIFSMSTYTNDGELEHEIMGNFSSVFKKFPKIGFIWRINEIPEKFQAENIKVFKWIPQRTLFNHPKAMAVITHCGQNSFLEAVNAGLPIIGIPTMGDQFPNTQRAKYRQIGVGLSPNNLTETTIFDAIQKIQLDPNSKENMELHPIPNGGWNGDFDMDKKFWINLFSRLARD